MTAAVYRNAPSLSIPQSQNTAPVLEFNCLYTHDVKKKAKKWQDGFLRYHTFNKRVMVYDIPRNLIGDMHWTGDEAIQEGDELRLERNGAMVQVGDNVGQVEADLSELRKTTKKASKPVKITPPPGRAPILLDGRPAAQHRSSALSRPNTQLKHKSLNALLGTPKGPIGKASLPQRTPFEERRKERQETIDLENEEWDEGRPPKRARTDNSPAWSITRTTETTKQTKSRESPLWARTTDAAKQKKKDVPVGQQRLATMEIVELSDDDPSQSSFLPGFSDAALVPSSPRKKMPKEVQKSARSSSPAPRPPRLPQMNASKQAVKDAERRDQMPQRSSPPVQKAITSEKPAQKQKVNVAPVEPEDDQRHQRPPSPNPSKPPSSRLGQKLRLAASAPKKKTLLCQEQLNKKPRRVLSANSQLMADSLFSTVANVEDDDLPRKRPKSAQEQMAERLARIDKKKGSTSLARLQQPSKKKPAPIEIPSDNESSSDLDEEDNDPPPQRPATAHETSAMELRRLDEMMLPLAPPHVPASRTRSPEPEPPEAQPPAPPKQIERPFRRPVSKIQKPSTKPKRIPGAPVRFTPTPTPSPTMKSRKTTPAVSRPATPSDDSKPAFQTRVKSKRPLSKSVSSNVTANGISTVVLNRPFQAPGKPTKTKAPLPPEPQGPWTREAFDLFVWRPPNWDEAKWCVTDGDDGKEGEAVKENARAPASLSGGVSMPSK